MASLSWFTRPKFPTLLALAALILGLGLGIVVSATQSAPLRILAVAIEPLGALWVNAISRLREI